jgi:hypothetical protein
MKMTAYWDIVPYSLEVDRHFRGAYTASIALMMGAVHILGTLVYFKQTIWHYIPESYNLHVPHKFTFACTNRSAQIKFQDIPDFTHTKILVCKDLSISLHMLSSVCTDISECV